MIITTTPTIEGHTIKEYKGIVSGEVIFGMNFVKDFFASIHDVFGGRSNSYEQSMIEGRQTAQKEMEQRAKALGANAIVGVHYGYETMGANGSMLILEEIEFLQGMIQMANAHQEALEEKEEKLRQEISRLDALKKAYQSCSNKTKNNANS